MRTLLIAIAALMSFTVLAGDSPPVSLRSGPAGSLVATTTQANAEFNYGSGFGGSAFYDSLTKHPNFARFGGKMDLSGVATIDVEIDHLKFVLTVNPDGKATLTDKSAPPPFTFAGGCSSSNPGLPLAVALTIIYLLRRLWARRALRSGGAGSVAR